MKRKPTSTSPSGEGLEAGPGSGLTLSGRFDDLRKVTGSFPTTMSSYGFVCHLRGFADPATR